LTVRLFGTLELARAGCPLASFPTRKAKSLFCYLVLNRGRAIPRDSLTGLLWGEHPDGVARKNLRTDVWRVRRLLETDGIPAGTYILADTGRIGFNPEAACWVDVEEFEDRVSACRDRPAESLAPPEAEALRRAVTLYRGDVLEELYDDWSDQERTRLRSLLLTAQEKLLRYHAGRAEWGQALAWGARILDRDPLREHVHRHLMLCHYELGDRPAAIRQFQACVRLLRVELDIEPMRETLRLFRAIETETVAGERLPGP
jgi:DNA-binding SARP family transcriptional activator